MCIGASFWKLPSVLTAAVMLIPLIVDGFVQLKTPYESTNLRRVITGFFFGYGLCSLFLLSSGYVFRLGQTFGKTL